MVNEALFMADKELIAEIKKQCKTLLKVIGLFLWTKAVIS